MSDRDTVIRDLYVAIDRKDWSAATENLRPDVTWIVTNTDLVRQTTLQGVDAVRDWFRTALGPLDCSQTLREVAHCGETSAAIVDVRFRHQDRMASGRIVDVYRFDDELIAERLRTQSE